MNFEILSYIINNYIDDLYKTNTPEYNVKYYNCSYNASGDLGNIGFRLIKFLKLDVYNLDIIITDNYFIFDYNDTYIIINYTNEFNDVSKYKILTVKTRNEALRFRYSY